MNSKAIASLSFIVAFTADALAIRAIMAAPIWLNEAGEALLFHAVSIAFSYLFLLSIFPESYKKSKGITFLLVFGFTVPLPLMGLLFLSLFFRLMRQERKENPEKNYFFGERQVLTLLRFEEPGKATSQSVLDILGGEDNNVRRNAILALRAVEAKKALPVLQKAIADSDEQVRLLAQTQFNKIIQALELSIKKTEAELAEAKTAEPLKLLQLAEQYHELVYLGVSSEETDSIYLQRAIDLLEQAAKIDPNNLSAQFLLLKCYVKNKMLQEAQECADRLKEGGYQPEFLAPWECDIYFQQRNWQALEETLQEMQRKHTTDPRLRSLIELWVGNQAQSPAT